MVNFAKSLLWENRFKVRPSRAGLFGGPISFQATFTDGSQGVFTMDLSSKTSELRIAVVENVQGDLRLTFTSIAGQKYIVQTRSDLSSGSWANLPGAPIFSTSNTVQVRFPIAPAEAGQFFRIQVAPWRPQNHWIAIAFRFHSRLEFIGLTLSGKPSRDLSLRTSVTPNPTNGAFQ